MSKAWNKGLTKLTNPAVAKISSTFIDKKIDNFVVWRKEQAKQRPKEYKRLVQNGDLAELIGVILGDGHIGQHERTQVLRIVSNSNNQGFVCRYSKLVEKVFAKTPHVSARKNSNCTNITIYQNEIAERLNLQTGSKTHRPFELPEWISKSTVYKIRFLRGLYETDGCLAHHEKTYTHKFIFSNVNQSLLDLAYMLLCELGFHPTKTKVNVQISRKLEVTKASDLLKFREYD
jgi:hypothetical protein